VSPHRSSPIYSLTSDSRPIDEAWEKILSGKDPGDRLRLLLGSNEEYIDSKAFTLLHKVVLGILYVDLDQLLDASCADIDQQDADGKTPLAWAALRRDHHSLAILLSHHADTTKTCKLGRTVLHYACRGGSSECIKVLISRPDVEVNSIDDNGNAALHFASQLPPHESSSICASLLQAGVDVNHRDRNGWNATFWATEHDDAANLRQLILSGAYIEYRLQSGHTPLTLAVNRNSINCLRVLLDHGADVCATMKNGWGILHIAAYFGTVESMRVLEEARCSGLDAERLDQEGKKAEAYLLQRENLCEDLAVAFGSLLASLGPGGSLPKNEDM
jgi:ankyrin repeat protein